MFSLLHDDCTLAILSFVRNREAIAFCSTSRANRLLLVDVSPLWKLFSHRLLAESDSETEKPADKTWKRHLLERAHGITYRNEKKVHCNTNAARRHQSDQTDDRE